jgi:FO synthase
MALTMSHGSFKNMHFIALGCRAKKGTAMQHWPEPSLQELLWSVAVARLVLPPEVSIQVNKGAGCMFNALVSGGFQAMQLAANKGVGINRKHTLPAVTRVH